MAKAIGPLMSISASGAFGKALVFGTWKGRNTIRQLVTPSNPQSSGQETSRNAVRVMAAGQHFANFTVQLRDSETLTDKALLTGLAPSGQAWNGFLVKSGIGSGAVNYTADEAAYAALSSGEKTAWSTAAAALTPAISSVNQTMAGGSSTTAATPGKVFFHYVAALSRAGSGSYPTATPPTYA